MPDEHTPRLQHIAPDWDWWSAHAGMQYRELARWLCGIAAKCQFPATQKELLDLAWWYNSRADRIDRQPAGR